MQSLYSDVTRAEYVGDGPVLPGESVHQALGENTAQSLGGHLIGKPTQGVAGPSNFRSANGDLQGGTQDGSQPYSFAAAHEEAAGQARQVLRPGAV